MGEARPESTSPQVPIPHLPLATPNKTSQDKQSLQAVLNAADKANGALYASLASPQLGLPPEFLYGAAHRRVAFSGLRAARPCPPLCSQRGACLDGLRAPPPPLRRRRGLLAQPYRRAEDDDITRFMQERYVEGRAPPRLPPQLPAVAEADRPGGAGDPEAGEAPPERSSEGWQQRGRQRG
jgi:hypothetical protein